MTDRSASRAGSQRMPARREGGQVRVGEQLDEKFRAQGGHHLHRAKRRTQQGGPTIQI